MVALFKKEIIIIVLLSQYCLIVEAVKINVLLQMSGCRKPKSILNISSFKFVFWLLDVKFAIWLWFDYGIYVQFDVTCIMLFDIYLFLKNTIRSGVYV